MLRVTVYGICLADGKIRYVGQTTWSLAHRLSWHRKSQTHHLGRWLRENPAHRIFAIEQNAVLHDTERRLIAWYRQHGADLINQTDGGAGTTGYVWTPEQIAKISAIRKGRVITPEWRANISRAVKGRVVSAATRERMSAAARGKKKSPEAVAKSAAARRGSKWSAEARQALSDQRKGTKKTPEHAQKLRAHLTRVRQAALAAQNTPEIKASKARKMRAWWAAKKGQSHAA